MKPSETASLSKSMWQNRKERTNWSRKNGDMAETGKRYVVCEWVGKGVSDFVCEWHRS